MKKIGIIYWSGTGNTKKIALDLNKVLSSFGDVSLYDLNEQTPDVLDFDLICLGCPATGKELLERTQFIPYLETIQDKVQNKDIIAFGSYGWGNGEWLDNLKDWIKLHQGEWLGSLKVKGEPQAGEVENFIQSLFK